MSRRPWFANKGGALVAKSKAAQSASDAAVDAFAHFYKQLNADSPDGLQSSSGKEEEDETDEEGKESNRRRSPKQTAAAAGSSEQRERVLRLFVRQDSDYYSVHGDAAYFVADEYNRTRVDIKSEPSTAATCDAATSRFVPSTDTICSTAANSATSGGVVPNSFHGSTCVLRR